MCFFDAYKHLCLSLIGTHAKQTATISSSPGGPEDPKYLSDDKDRDALRTEMIQEQEVGGGECISGPADRTEAQAQMPGPKGPGEQPWVPLWVVLKIKYIDQHVSSTRTGISHPTSTPRLFYSLMYLKHLEEFLAHCRASINICGTSQVRKQGSSTFYIL